MSHPLDPDACVLTRHALDRYAQRRRTGDPEAGLRKLLARVAAKEWVSPPRTDKGPTDEPRRFYRVGEFGLVLTTDHRCLVTVLPTGPAHRHKGIHGTRSDRRRRPGGKFK